MKDVLDIPETLLPVQATILAGLDRVQLRFDEQLRSDLPPVDELCTYVERYRGKMLRPALALLCGLAANDKSAPYEEIITNDHITVGAVCEMIHMATLVHDDVLDEADVRRRGKTVNRLRGNEAAVILGDYLIAGSFHLCSQLDSQKVALLVGHVSMTMCAGELLQLHFRNEFSLDEPTYFEILDRKTAALIGLACRLGALSSGATEIEADRFDQFGKLLGVAFQIQDDILDLTAAENVVGKSVGRDLAKGKLTLPLIRHLAGAGGPQRGRTLELLEAVAADSDSDARQAIADMLDADGSIASARQTAADLVDKAKTLLQPVKPGGPRDLLLLMADGVVDRSF